ncbi:TetR/AcrR family transcriptional regulator [Klebsiella pneumoniae subsp. pneumoniae]|nr:TetR/AcrR family transcriptional regulator [Klebsiella pneumoniae subsp. pneumoniae]
MSTRAGISQGAMYTYFKSKDELVKAIVLGRTELRADCP